MNIFSRNRTGYVYLIAFAASLFLVIIIFSSHFSGASDFIADDHYYIVNNSRVHNLNLLNLKRIWTKPLELDYLPVTETSFAIDYALWGPNPVMFRITNIVIYLIIILLCLSMTFRLSRFVMDDTFSVNFTIAAVFLAAFHPAQIESVAGIAYRKELLYVLFGLTSFLCFLNIRRSSLYLMTSILFLILAQLSKGTAVVLPLLFLFVERVTPGEKKDLRRALLAIAPFFLVALSLFAYQYKIALTGQVLGGDRGLSTGTRISGVVLTLHTALSHILYPVDLTYEYDLKWPSALTFGPEWILPITFLILVGALAMKRKWKILFLSALPVLLFLPYSNIIPIHHINVENIVYYDHYLLFPLLFMAPLLSVLLFYLFQKNRSIPLVLCIVILGAYLYQDHVLAGSWKNREALYSRAIKYSPGISRPYAFLGHVYLEKGRYERALEFFSKGKEAGGPLPLEFLLWEGNANAFSGRYVEAERTYLEYLETRPDDIRALQNLSSTLIMLRKYNDAEKILQKLFSLSPNDPIGLGNLDYLKKQRRVQE